MLNLLTVLASVSLELTLEQFYSAFEYSFDYFMLCPHVINGNLGSFNDPFHLPDHDNEFSILTLQPLAILPLPCHLVIKSLDHSLVTLDLFSVDVLIALLILH
jgi:hypothetical protein